MSPKFFELLLPSFMRYAASFLSFILVVKNGGIPGVIVLVHYVRHLNNFPLANEPGIQVFKKRCESSEERL